MQLRPPKNMSALTRDSQQLSKRARELPLKKTGEMKAVSHHAKRMLPNLIPRMKKQTVAPPSTNQRMICPKTLRNFVVETSHCDVNPSRVTRQDARAFLRPAHTTDDPSVERFRNTCQQMFVEFSRAVSHPRRAFQ